MPLIILKNRAERTQKLAELDAALANLPAEEKNRRDLEIKLSKTSTKVREIERKIGELNKEKSKLENEKYRLITLNKRIDALKISAESKRTQLEVLKINSDANESAEKTAQIHLLEKEKGEIEVQISSFEKTRQETQEQYLLSDLDSVIANLESSITNLESAIKELAESKKPHSDHIAQLERKIASYNALNRDELTSEKKSIQETLTLEEFKKLGSAHQKKIRELGHYIAPSTELIHQRALIFQYLDLLKILELKDLESKGKDIQLQNVSHLMSQTEEAFQALMSIKKEDGFFDPENRDKMIVAAENRNEEFKSLLDSVSPCDLKEGQTNLFDFLLQGGSLISLTLAEDNLALQRISLEMKELVESKEFQLRPPEENRHLLAEKLSKYAEELINRGFHEAAALVKSLAKQEKALFIELSMQKIKKEMNVLVESKAFQLSSPEEQQHQLNEHLIKNTVYLADRGIHDAEALIRKSLAVEFSVADTLSAIEEKEKPAVGNSVALIHQLLGMPVLAPKVEIVVNNPKPGTHVDSPSGASQAASSVLTPRESTPNTPVTPGLGHGKR